MKHKPSFYNAVDDIVTKCLTTLEHANELEETQKFFSGIIASKVRAKVC